MSEPTHVPRSAIVIFWGGKNKQINMAWFYQTLLFLGNPEREIFFAVALMTTLNFKLLNTCR